jgi:hypothetical protein
VAAAVAAAYRRQRQHERENIRHQYRLAAAKSVNSGASKKIEENEMAAAKAYQYLAWRRKWRGGVIEISLASAAVAKRPGGSVAGIEIKRRQCEKGISVNARQRHIAWQRGGGVYCKPRRIMGEKRK